MKKLYQKPVYKCYKGALESIEEIIAHRGHFILPSLRRDADFRVAEGYIHVPEYEWKSILLEALEIAYNMEI